MLQFTDVREEKNEEPMTSQVIKTEPKLSCMSCCWVLCTFNKYSQFLASLVVCIHETVGLWSRAVLMLMSRAIWIVWQIGCEVPLPLCCKTGLRRVKSWQTVMTVILRKKNEQSRFRQYFQPFSSECFLILIYETDIVPVIFFVCVKFGLLCQEKKMDWGFVRAGWWGEYLMWEGGRTEGC